jgi:hypothetical protein
MTSEQSTMAIRRPVLVWKYEDEVDDGSEVGPAWLDTFGEHPTKPTSSEDLGWITRAEAQRIAAERGYELLEDE